MRSKSSQRGVVLISVLWVIAALSMIVASGLLAVRTDIQLTRNHLKLAQARSVAEAGVYWGIRALLLPRENVGPGLPEGPVDLTWDDARVTIEIENEAGKIDVNTASAKLIEGALLNAGVDSSHARSLMREYERTTGTTISGQDSAPANKARFVTVEHFVTELDLSVEDRRRITPWLTVHNRREGINPTVSSREVLLTVPGVSESSVDRYLSQRERSPLLQPNMGSVNQYFSDRLSSVYTINAYARVDGISSAVTTKVRLSALRQSPFEILRWRSAPGRDAT